MASYTYYGWLTVLENMYLLKDKYKFLNYCWLVRGSLFIELGCPRDFGKGWRGDLGTFMISRPI